MQRSFRLDRNVIFKEYKNIRLYLSSYDKYNNIYILNFSKSKREGIHSFGFCACFFLLFIYGIFLWMKWNFSRKTTLPYCSLGHGSVRLDWIGLGWVGVVAAAADPLQSPALARIARCTPVLLMFSLLSRGTFESLWLLARVAGRMWAENVFLWQRRSIYYFICFFFLFVCSLCYYTHTHAQRVCFVFYFSGFFCTAISWGDGDGDGMFCAAAFMDRRRIGWANWSRPKCCGANHLISVYLSWHCCCPLPAVFVVACDHTWLALFFIFTVFGSSYVRSFFFFWLSVSEIKKNGAEITQEMCVCVPRSEEAEEVGTAKSQKLIDWWRRVW